MMRKSLLLPRDEMWKIFVKRKLGKYHVCAYITVYENSSI